MNSTRPTRSHAAGLSGRLAAALCTCVLLVACATNPALQESRQLVAQGQHDAALARMEQALRENPDNRELRAYYLRQRDLVVAQTLAQADSARAAGQRTEAEAAYQRVLKLDGSNGRARAGLALLAAGPRHDGMVREAETALKAGDTAAADARVRTVLAENPAHAGARELMRQLQESSARAKPVAQALKGPFSQPITLEFRDANLKQVFEVISRTSGVNFVFDKDVRPDIKVTIFVRNTSIDDVIKLILATNQLERKLLNENSVLIYPNTAAKAKEYQELVVRSFFLANADAKQALTLVKSMVKSRDVFIDEKLNLLVIRDTAEAVRLAERLLESLDLAEPEVMLEVEVMEVSRTKLQELGLRYPDQIGYGLLTPTTTSTVITTTGTQTTTNLGGTIAPGFINLRERSATIPFVANPGLTLNLRSEDGDSNLLANPRIRVKNKEKAKVHIGEKLPVFTTTSTANVGVSASVSYLDVGLKLDVEPSVGLEDEVSIKIGLEVSSVVREVPGPQQSLAYQVGTRSAATTLRLRNGETQVLAGLINDEERSSANKVPGLGDIPVLGRLFSSHKDSANKTEIVLLITPRILRNVARPEAVAALVPSGTDAAVGAPPLRLQATAPRSLGLSSSATGGPAVAPALLPPGIAPLAPEPAEARAPAPPAGLPQLGLVAPAQAKLGGEVEIIANLVAATGARGGEVELVYDPTALELIGGKGAPGRAAVELLPVEGVGLVGQARFKVIAKAAGSTVFEVASVQATDAAGARLVVNPPEPQPLNMVP
jgi:general secretion pathway protein D